MNAWLAAARIPRPYRSSSRQRRWHRAAVVGLTATLALTAAAPAWATDSVTGDVTAPTIVSLSLDRSSVDVTDGSATVSVTGRFTDSDTGVTGATLSWMSPAEQSMSYGTSFALVSGDAADGVYTASMTIPRAAAPGQWPLDVQVSDRAGNHRIARAGDLQQMGLPGYLAVASSHPDVTAPALTGLEISPSQVDVRSGPASLTVRLHLVDDASGTSWLFVPPTSPHGGSGGAEVPTMKLVSGTANDGWWQGQLPIAEHAHAGTWSFGVRTFDVLNNIEDYSAADLSARGMSTQFTVLSDEDVIPPAFTSASLSAVALDVSHGDQQLSFNASVTDAMTGVQDYSWGSSNVQIDFQHPLGQMVGRSSMPRTSGTANDGRYGTVLTFPQHSATGVWTTRVYASDKITNMTSLTPAQMAELGLPATILVYNTPLPPLNVAVKPGDATALVQWQPPSDDRGAAVTDYVVRELPDGHSVTVDGSSLSAVVPQLSNGVQHSFVVRAVNRAGESDPSDAVAAVPQAGLAVPSPDPSPAPSPTKTATPAATPSASPTSARTPTPNPTTTGTPASGADPNVPMVPAVTVWPSVISAGQRVVATYRGTPGDTISVWSKTQPATEYTRIATVTLDADGFASTSHVPGRNTRIEARSSDGRQSAQPLIQVRSLASLSVARNATRTYTFTGTVSPTLSGRLVSLYRDGTLIAQTRASSTGVYVIRKTLAAGTFMFQVKTSNDTYNLGATSRLARTWIY